MDQKFMDQNNYRSHEKSLILINRCTCFAENVILTLQQVSVSPINRRIIEQCSASAGSIGANYCEASEAESRKDFVHKVGIAKKEAKETMHWLRILATSNPEKIVEFRTHWKEASELLLIFSKMVWTARDRMNSKK